MRQNPNVISSFISMFVESRVVGVYGGYILFTIAHFSVLTMCKVDLT